MWGCGGGGLFAFPKLYFDYAAQSRWPKKRLLIMGPLMVKHVRHNLRIFHNKRFRLGIIVYLSHRSHLKKEPRPGNKIWWAVNILNNPPGRGC